MTRAACSVGWRLLMIVVAAALAVIFVSLTGLHVHADAALGIFAVVLAVSVILVAALSEISLRREDGHTLKDATSIAGQCGHIYEILKRVVGGQGDDAYRALDQLAVRIRLLVTQYRRYLRPTVVESLRHAERELLAAQISRDVHVRLMLIIGNAVETLLKDGFRDVDDPELAAMRRRV